MASDGSEKPTDSALRKQFSHAKRLLFAYWRAFSGPNIAVLLVGIVAALAFIIGLSHLRQERVALNGPLATFLPTGGDNVIRFVSLLLAFLLTAITVGLQRRKRLMWYGAVIVLPLASLLALVTAQATDLLLLLFSFVILPLLIRNRDQFDQPIKLTPFQIAALGSFLAVQVYGTIGVYVLRDEYTGVETWTDAFYYMIVTGTTVGYGDIRPTTGQAKLFTISVLVIGTTAFGAAFGSFLVPALESRITTAVGKMTTPQHSQLKDHVLILGYSNLTEPLLNELTEATDVVVITSDTETATTLKNRDINVLTADPTDTEALRDARADVASGIVATTGDDGQNTLAVIAARQVNPDVCIVTAANEQRHVDKLEGIGADEVISPTVIGGRLLGRSVLGDTPLVDLDDVPDE
ncbi:NAD-binding protein [Halocatena marina]|uniref:NAD-binding protein n=1 Tax=Halocatena marina TaxID=2934937 RepID=A0ABD5YU10_9EURY|nr:NAD-binding protein [Halocatena marina]